MKSIDMNDSFSKLPVHERLLQQRQQQPVVNQDLNVRAYKEETEQSREAPQENDAAEDGIVDREKRDREFQERNKKKKEKKEKKSLSKKKPWSLLDLEG